MINNLEYEVRIKVPLAKKVCFITGENTKIFKLS